jgi:hypothetical protein
MPRFLPVDNFLAAWNHFHEKLSIYQVGRDCVEFSNFLDDDGVTHIVLQAEVTNVNDFHSMLWKMVDDFPILYMTDMTRKILGSVTIKNCDLSMFELNGFHYYGCGFRQDGEDCKLVLRKFEE